jgi:hypothetical protein
MAKRTAPNHRSRLTPAANAALESALPPGEPVRVILRGAYGSALIASDRRGFIWKKKALHAFPFENLSQVAFGGGALLKWVQFRGPSIGLVEPDLLNIGDLPDAIQLGEIPSPEAWARLEALVRTRGRSLPLRPSATSAQRGGEARRSDADQDARLRAEGAGAHLLVFGDRIRIIEVGLESIFGRASPLGSQDIALDRIAELQWRDPGALRLGHIRFRLRDQGVETRSQRGSETVEVRFYKHQELPFRQARAELVRRLGGDSSSEPLLDETP